MFVLVTGNPFDGMQVFGPIATEDEAEELAREFSDTDWWIVPLVSPAEVVTGDGDAEVAERAALDGV